MKEGIIVGPQIKQIFEDQTFSSKLNFTERRAWKAFENIRRTHSRQRKTGKLQ